MNRKHKFTASAFSRGPRATTGFTLLELMIVVAIVAILATIAYPSYTHYIVKTHRAAATACLSEYANYMERYYTTNLNYNEDNLPVLNCNTQTNDNYSYALAAASTTAYTVQASPVNAQLTRDTKCGILSLDQAGARAIDGTGTLQNCWQ